MSLLKDINTFYRDYDVEHIGHPLTMTCKDMRNDDALMTAYEAVWLSMPYYEPNTEEYQWLADLYNAIGDYLHSRLFGNKVTIMYKWLVSIIDGVKAKALVKASAILVALIGLGIILGSAGSCDTNAISLGQAIIQSVTGVAIMLFGTIVYLMTEEGEA